VSRIDAQTRKVVRTMRTGGTPACIRTGYGSVWVGSQGGDFVFRIDPATNRVTRVRVGHDGELCVDVNRTGVWVSDSAHHSVTRLDPRTNRAVATVPVPGSPADGVRGPDGLEWIPLQGSPGKIARIDPATNRLVDTVGVRGFTFVVRSAFGSLWVGDFQGSTLYRIAPS
jgi:DNA-binding beta-propeller fold protein YncE